MEPRCGLTDAAFARSMVAKWGKKDLLWHLAQPLPALGAEKQGNILEAAFGSWHKVCDLRFKHTGDPRSADIVVGYGRGKRSDFDGRGGTLAWAGLPSSELFDGQLPLMFDGDEAWEAGIRTVNVAAHEIGHNLGLSHGPKGCLMAAVYSEAIATPQTWDIDEAVGRYGTKSSPEPTPLPTKPMRVAVEIDGEVWVFEGGRKAKGKVKWAA